MQKTIAIILIISANLFAQATVNNYLTNITKQKELKHAQVTVAAKYVDSKELLIDFDSERSLAPASGLKLFTTATALDVLGPGFRFVTKLAVNGEIKKGVLYGDIIIIGGGDPTLGSDRLEGSLSLQELLQHWTRIIRDYGIKRIKGSVLADDNLFDKIPVPGYWYWIDLGNYYAAQTSALTINENLYYLYFKPNKTVGAVAEFLRTEPELDGMVFINEMKTGEIGSGDNGYVFRSPYDSIASLRGSIPQGFNEFSIKGSLPDPPLFTAKTLTEYLEANNIKISGTPGKLESSENNIKVIDEIESPTLTQIVRNINKISNNLYTSQILKMTGLKKYGEGSREAGIKAIFSFLDENKIDTTGLSLQDGNGLSRSNMITAKMMTELLSAVYGKTYFKQFYNSLSIAGDPDDDGSFKWFGRGSILEKNARIKSGYIKGVRSHSGYMKGKSGKLIAFSIITNNFTTEVKNINNIHKDILIKIAEEF